MSLDYRPARDLVSLHAAISEAALDLAALQGVKGARLSLYRIADAIPTGAPSMAEIAQQVATDHDLTVADLRGSAKRKVVAHPRQKAMYLMYRTGKFSYGQIGHYLGKRDHTTVMDGVRRYAMREGL